jgi:hypothetical protein
MNAIRLATGFVVGFVSEVFRIVAWALLVVLSAYALGMPPLKTLAFVIAANVLGCWFYRV